MFIQLKRNKSGVVLFVVLMTVIIIMIIAASILSQSINEVNFTQQAIDEIATDQLTKGIFWKAYSPGSIQNSSTSFVLSNRTYVVNLNALAAVNGITSTSVVGNYDSFN